MYLGIDDGERDRIRGGELARDALAVLTQDNPKTATQPVAIQNNEAMHYGEQTIAGVTERLLGRAP